MEISVGMFLLSQAFRGLFASLFHHQFENVRSFPFTWNKMIGVGLLSAFNKGMSGGGFGPVVTAGRILSGQDHKAAIGVTTLAEAPICICGFFTVLGVWTLAKTWL